MRTAREILLQCQLLSNFFFFCFTLLVSSMLLFSDVHLKWYNGSCVRICYIFVIAHIRKTWLFTWLYNRNHPFTACHFCYFYPPNGEKSWKIAWNIVFFVYQKRKKIVIVSSPVGWVGPSKNIIYGNVILFLPRFFDAQGKSVRIRFVGFNSSLFWHSFFCNCKQIQTSDLNYHPTQFIRPFGDYEIFHTQARSWK